MSNEVFSLNFADLKDANPNRIVDLYRYRVKNYNTTLRRIISNPKRNVIFILTDEKKIEAFHDTFQGDKAIISILSSQNGGTSRGIISEQRTYVIGNSLPKDYRKEFYVYFDKPIPKKILSNEEIFIDSLASGMFPDKQEEFFKGTKNEDLKNNNILILRQLSIKTAGIPYKTYSYHDPEFSYIDGNKNIKLSTGGPMFEFGSSYLDGQNHRRQLEYDLLEDSTHLYATLQLQPTRLKPELVLSSDTYDKNKNLSFDLARTFIGSFQSIRSIWNQFGFSNLNAPKDNSTDAKAKAYAAAELYHALLSIIYLAQQRLTKFKEYRITDKNSPNLGKIDATMNGLNEAIYGISVDEILSTEQKEISARILKFWEGEFSKELSVENNDLNQLYQSVKSILACLTAYVPSPFSFGNYEKIGWLALEWYFKPETMNLSLEQIKSRADFKVQLFSSKFKFNISTKQIIGLTDEFKKISSVRNFNYDGQITLPSCPEQFTEEFKNTTSGSVDTSNNNFLRYTAIYQLKNTSQFAQIYQTDNPYILSAENKNSHFFAFTSDLRETEFGGVTNEIQKVISIIRIKMPNIVTGNLTSYPELDEYITDNLLIANRVLKTGSSKIEIEVITQQSSYKEYRVTFSWIETQSSEINLSPIKPPFSIDQSQFEMFEAILGSNLSEYIVKPILNQKLGSERKLNDIYFKTTVSNYAIINFTIIKDDGSSEEISWNIELAFKDDQTQVLEGIWI